MTAVLAPSPYLAFYDSDGNPLNGGLIYTYSAGTTTPKATYTDSGAGTSNANPVVLDSAGRAVIWISGNYKFVVKDSLGSTIRTVDNISSSAAALGDADYGDITVSGSGTVMTVDALAVTFGKIAAANVTSLQRKNHIINGSFNIWQRGTAVATATSATRNYLADRIFVNPAGANVTQQQQTYSAAFTGAVTQNALRIDGAASVTTVNIGTRLESSNMFSLLRTVTFSCYIYNNTAGSFTPSLLLGTPAAVDDFTTVTNKLTQTLQACPVGAYTQVSYSVDISGYTNINNGLQVEIQIPTGVLVAAQLIYVKEMQLEPGSSVTNFEYKLFSEDYFECKRYFQKSFLYATAPAQNAGQTGSHAVVSSGTTTLIAVTATIKMSPSMRVAPTVTTYNPSAANTSWRNRTGSTDLACTAAAAISQDSFVLTQTGAATDVNYYDIHWSATAEL